MTMTAQQARAAIGAMVAVIPEDAFPAGKWSGERKRTLHNDEVRRRAIPAQLIGVDIVPKPDGGRATVAGVAYASPATGTDYFYPSAIAGRWAELEQLRREWASESEREVRALRATRALGSETNAAQVHAEEIGRRWMVLQTVEAAERTVRLAAYCAAYLHAGRLDDAERCITEIIDYAIPERDLAAILKAAAC